MEDILRGYRDLTGYPSMPPLWSFGVWMSRMTYFSADEVDEIFLGYAASTWISQPITAVLYHAEAGSAAYQQSFYGAIVIAAIAVVLTVYMMVSDSKKKSA